MPARYGSGQGELGVIRDSQGRIIAVLDGDGRLYLALERTMSYIDKYGAWMLPLADWEVLKRRSGIAALVVYERDTGMAWEVDWETATSKMRKVLKIEDGPRLLLEEYLFSEAPPERAKPI